VDGDKDTNDVDGDKGTNGVDGDNNPSLPTTLKE